MWYVFGNVRGRRRNNCPQQFSLSSNYLSRKEEKEIKENILFPISPAAGMPIFSPRRTPQFPPLPENGFLFSFSNILYRRRSPIKPLVHHVREREGGNLGMWIGGGGYTQKTLFLSLSPQRGWHALFASSSVCHLTLLFPSCFSSESEGGGRGVLSGKSRPASAAMGTVCSSRANGGSPRNSPFKGNGGRRWLSEVHQSVIDSF